MDEEIGNLKSTKLQTLASQIFKKRTLEATKNLAKEKGLTAKQAEKITNLGTKAVAREVEEIQIKTNIEKNKLRQEFELKKAEAQLDKVALQKMEKRLEQELQKVDDVVVEQVKETLHKYTLNSTAEVIKKVRKKEKYQVEDDIRSRLRGFARTIPAFLMAYGAEETTLANFDKNISDAVFKEVTGISLEQFRILRDKYQFFDEIVFDESIQAFLAKRRELANYFDEGLKEDIFSYIPPQKTNQIFTPRKTVKAMVDRLQAEDPTIFNDPNKTFVDLYMKSGSYITEIVKRLYVGLADVIPDQEKRIKHILEKQVYGFAPTEIIYRIAHNYIFGFAAELGKIDDSHIVLLDTTPFACSGASGQFAEKCDELFGGK